MELNDFSRVASAWEKWEERLAPCYKELNRLLLNAAEVRTGDFAVDLGCGAGQPAIQLASVVGSDGKVVGLDISEEILQQARRRAELLRLTNIEFMHHSIESLPFPESSVDCVTARFCFMFLSSPERTLTETHRILKTARKISVSVWGSSEKNPLPGSILQHYCDVPSEDPNVIGPYRFAGSGKLMQLMRNAGFKETSEQEVLIREVFTSGREYVDHLVESSVLWGSRLVKMSPGTFRIATDQLIEAAEQFRAGDLLEIPRCALVVSAKK